MYKIDKETGDLVISGFEQGIANSPHKGIANIQNANISTEMGEVMNSFARTQQTMTNTVATGSLVFVDTNHVSLSIANTNNLFKGNWITVTNSSHTGELPNGTYYVPPSTGANFQLANYYNTLTYTLPVTANYAIIGAGGGGGTGTGVSTGGGGGGGGQVLTGTASLTAQAYTITLGTGGAGGAEGGSAATDGGTSSALSVTAAGGKAGLGGAGPSSGDSPPGTPSNGGNSGSGKTGGAGQAAGGAGGGGGGDSVNGGGYTGTAGLGGNGTAISISGTSITYGGGGGGGATPAAGAGTGGTGGGANGGATHVVGSNAAVNTGGGGGGGGGSNIGSAPGGNGGTGIVVISYPTASIIGATGGVMTQTNVAGVSYNVHTFTASGTFTVPASPTTVLTGFTSGLTANFTLVATMGNPIAQTTENYYLNGIVYHRYYILDANNLVWVYDDQNETLYSTSDNVSWFLPDFHTDWCTRASGLSVINGFLVGATEHGLFGKSVINLGNTGSTSTTWTQFPDITGWQGSSREVSIPHFAFAGHQGKLRITDASYLVEIFPDSSLRPGATLENIQTFCSWTIVSADPTGQTGTFSIINGVTPVPSDLLRVPAVFFTVNGGVLPTAITAGTVYYIDASILNFNVYSASSGGSALDISTGSLGPQYFNSFYPIASASASTGATPLSVLTAQIVVLPSFETAQCMAEIGNTILIGCLGNVIYPWNQIDNLPSDIISLPESGVVNILTVNQMGYIFAGNKGNIYISDGNTASLVTSVPDYTAGIPGTTSSYIEPIFTWGGQAYVRGRVYFSILDQTSTKAGNCGGIWSFVPTQNFYIGQDVGISLRLENQNSYGTYNGFTPIIVTKQTQNAIAPQYWSAWKSDTTTPTYGIDSTGTGTASTSPTVIETDIIPTGTFLDKKTYAQIEFKLSTPLATGAVVSMKYRKDLTSAWTSCGTAVMQNSNRLSGYFPANFEKTQWLQLQATLTPTTVSPGTFIRMSEIRVR